VTRVRVSERHQVVYRDVVHGPGSVLDVDPATAEEWHTAGLAAAGPDTEDSGTRRRTIRKTSR
jgi:hypothetical protein